MQARHRRGKRKHEKAVDDDASFQMCRNLAQRFSAVDIVITGVDTRDAMASIRVTRWRAGTSSTGGA